jgi:hypothetical protein
MLLARGSLTRTSARALVLASLSGLATLGVLVILVPLGPGGSPESRLYPAFDVMLGGALVSLVALGVRRAWALATLLVAAVALGRAAGTSRSALAVGIHVGETLTGALFFASAAMLAAALAAVRFRVTARRTTRS